MSSFFDEKEIMMTVIVERSETQNTRQTRCIYTITLPTDEVVKQTQDKWLWKKFMPGQLRIKAEAWYKNGELIVGKVIKDKE